MDDVITITDEIWPESGEYDTNWIWIGTAFVEKQYARDIANELLFRRYVGDWSDIEDASDLFERNNREVKFCDLSTNDKYYVAKRWMDIVTNCRLISEHLKLKVTGIDYNKIQQDLFDTGDHKNVNEKIYSSLFGSHLKGSCKHFFDGTDVNLNPLIHHQGNQESYNGFETKVKQKSGLDIQEIRFIESDHREYGMGQEKFYYANFVQFIDVLLGGVSKLFHEKPINKNQYKIVKTLQPVVKASMEHDEDVTNRFTVGFFPDSEDPKNGEFYYERPIKRDISSSPFI